MRISVKGVIQMCMDIKIIREYMQNKTVCDIKSIVFIDNREYIFTRQEIPEIMLSMVLPNEITYMNPYSTKIKFPDENRPDVILSIPDDDTTNFLFSSMDDEVFEEDLQNISQKILIVLKRMNAGATFYQTGNIQSELLNIWWFDYSTAAIDDDIYNIMYIFYLNDILIIGGFCCLQKFRKQWKPLVLQMLETITVCEENVG